jgi:hypothetical protein
LCSITHNTFSENEQWKQFRETTKLPLEFLHSDEFEAKYQPIETKYPVILLEENKKLREWISKSELEEVENTEKLIRLVETKAKAMHFSNLD